MCASSPEATLLDALLAVHGVLQAEGIEHALCGGIAANLYRDDIRTTTDVDLYIACTGPKLVKLTRVFENLGWEVHPAWHQAELMKLERPDHPRVDLLIAATEYERAAIRRAIDAEIDADVIRVLIPEDLIVFKLVAGRARDYEAVAAILNGQAVQVDTAYIEEHLRSLGLVERWSRALDEAVREADDPV